MESKSNTETELPKSVFFVLNPEGRAFDDSVSYRADLCRSEFVKSWFAGWKGMYATSYEADVVFKMFERAGFKLIEVPLPGNKKTNL
jgi:hypothetical protein